MSRRLIELSAVLAVFAACQDVRTARPGGGTVITATNQVPATPAVPETKNLDRYVWGTPLYPERTQSAYTVYLQSPRDPARFEVYGFDPKRGVAVFHGEGYKRSAYAPTQDQIHKDLAPHGSSIQWGTTGQIDIPPPPPGGPPPIDELRTRDWAWQKAYTKFQGDIRVIQAGRGTITTVPGTITTQNPATIPTGP